MRQNVVVVWIECLLVGVVRHTGTLAPDHVHICLPVLRPYSLGDALRSLYPMKSAQQQADVVEPRRREYQASGCIHCRVKSLQKVRRNACQGRVTEIKLNKYKRDYH